MNEAIRPYLNSRKVPQLLNATGASTWGKDFKQYPWTGGWQPDYEYEARIYGTAIARNSPNAKIGVLYQNDSFGADNLRGLKAGLGAKASNIVGEESYEVTAADVRAQVARLRGSGATVFVIFATPRFTVQAYAIANALAVVARGDLHDLGLRDGHLPDAREDLGRRRSPGADVLGPVREGPGVHRRGTTTPA